MRKNSYNFSNKSEFSNDDKPIANDNDKKSLDNKINDQGEEIKQGLNVMEEEDKKISIEVSFSNSKKSTTLINPNNQFDNFNINNSTSMNSKRRSLTENPGSLNQESAEGNVSMKSLSNLDPNSLNKPIDTEVKSSNSLQPKESIKDDIFLKKRIRESIQSVLSDIDVLSPDNRNNM